MPWLHRPASRLAVAQPCGVRGAREPAASAPLRRVGSQGWQCGRSHGTFLVEWVASLSAFSQSVSEMPLGRVCPLRQPAPRPVRAPLGRWAWRASRAVLRRKYFRPYRTYTNRTRHAKRMKRKNCQDSPPGQKCDKTPGQNLARRCTQKNKQKRTPLHKRYQMHRFNPPKHNRPSEAHGCRPKHERDTICLHMRTATSRAPTGAGVCARSGRSPRAAQLSAPGPDRSQPHMVRPEQRPTASNFGPVRPMLLARADTYDTCRAAGAPARAAARRSRPAVPACLRRRAPAASRWRARPPRHP